MRQNSPGSCTVLGLSVSAQAAAAEREADQVDKYPRPSAAGSMRHRGISTTGAQRRADGTIDAHRTDSHDSRIYEQEDLPVHLFVSAVFSSTGRGAEGELPRRGKRSPSGGFSFVKTKENGGGSPAGTPRLPPGPPGKAVPSDTPPAPAPSSVICSANATFPRWGKALCQGRWLRGASRTGLPSSAAACAPGTCSQGGRLSVRA